MNELVNLLRGILVDRKNRVQLIKEFQERVWDSTAESLNVSPSEFDLLSALAYDLDFYEEDPKLRTDDVLYGDENLEIEVEAALQKIGKRELQ